MSKYLKVTILIVLGMNTVWAESYTPPSLNELKAKINKDESNYNYVEVNNQSEYDDLVKERGEDFGISLEDNDNREVINVVKIKNVSDRKEYLADEDKYLHNASLKPNKNLGIAYEGDVSNQELTNVVDIQNSSLSGSANSGVSISTDRTVSNASIENSTTIRNSALGNK